MLGLFKGPLKLLLMPLLGKNQLAITLHTYASFGPFWTILIGGKYSPAHDVIAPRAMSRDQKQKSAFYLNGLNILSYFLYNNNSKAVSKKFKLAFWLMMKNKEMRKENVLLRPLFWA